jgi:alpha-beta hydrolase superfamily lysophospholipase
MKEKAFQHAAGVSQPTLIVQGEADTEALPSGAVKLFEALRVEDKTLKMVPDAGHFLFAKNEQVFLAVTDWLRSH